MPLVLMSMPSQQLVLLVPMLAPQALLQLQTLAVQPVRVPVPASRHRQYRLLNRLPSPVALSFPPPQPQQASLPLAWVLHKSAPLPLSTQGRPKAESGYKKKTGAFIF